MEATTLFQRESDSASAALFILWDCMAEEIQKGQEIKWDLGPTHLRSIASSQSTPSWILDWKGLRVVALPVIVGRVDVHAGY